MPSARCRELRRKLRPHRYHWRLALYDHYCGMIKKFMARGPKILPVTECFDDDDEGEGSICKKYLASALNDDSQLCVEYAILLQGWIGRRAEVQRELEARNAPEAAR